MFKRFYIFLLVAFILVLFTSQASAQFEQGKNYIGAHVGISSIGSVFSFGADYEYGYADVGQYGPGRVGIGGIIDYWNWSDGFWSFTWIPIGVLAYYHLNLPDKKLDLFGGLGVGYEIVTASWNGFGLSGTADYASSVTGIAQIGARYFFTPNLAAETRLGFGASVWSVGIDYKY